MQGGHDDIPDIHDGVDGRLDSVPDGYTGGILLVLPVDDHPVTGVTVHTVLDCRVQL